MARLWDKGEPLDDRVCRFTVGRDPVLDLRLVVHDALASAAHAVMLQRIGMLSQADLTALRSELARIAEEAAQGTFTIHPEEEDCHTAIENRLTARLGDAGRRIHTGRSRNDQVIAALRLFARQALLGATDQLIELAMRLLDLAEVHREVSLPGYSHTRQAMPSTLGLFFGAYAEGLADTLPWIQTAFAHLNRSPLGSASGYGVALPLDRELVADLLCFDRVQVNTLAVQNDRGKTEYLVLGALLAPVVDLGRLAADLIWMSSDEIGFVTLPVTLTTGSSIMPQKRNPDALELVRAHAARLVHRHAEIASMYGRLGAGYHRDLQLTKDAFLDGMTTCADVMAVMGIVAHGLQVDAQRCRAAVLPATGATDEVYRRVAAGEPFRSAYRAVAADPTPRVDADEVAEAWRQRTHVGAPGDLDLLGPRDALAQGRRWVTQTGRRLEEAWRLLEDPS